MNVTVKPKAFQKRKPSPIAAQATASAETFVRYVVTKAIEQLERKRDAYTIATTKFPGDARLRTVIRASAEPPTSLANTPALAVMGTDYVESLQPISAAAQLFRASRMMLNFDRLAAISVPELTGFDGSPPSWVAEGQPAPVGELAAGGTVLEPYKMEFIVTVTREMLLSSNAEKLIGDALRSKIAYDLDQALFDALPASPSRPAGLRSYNARLPESTASSNEVMAMMDIGTLVAAAEQIAGGEPFYFIGRSKRIAALRLMMKQTAPPNFVLLPSAASLALPESVLLCVIPRAVPSAVGLPEVELVESGAVEMNDAPASTDLMTGGNVRSLFQSDTIGLKVRLPASWGLRHAAGANWITCVWPSDLGAGGGTGIPDAPTDGTFYGRHDGGWGNVVEEAPVGGPVYGRQASAWTEIPAGVGEAPPDGFTHGRRNTGWQQLETIFAGIISPAFQGAPTAPNPPPLEDSTRIPTTAWTRATIATEAGGVGDVPATPNGAFARVRTGATASWMDFVALRVASLDNPIFASGTAGNMSVGLGDNQSGFWRAGSGPIVVSINGTALAQFQPGITAFFEPVNMGNFTIQALGDPAAPTDALNLRTGDSRYLRSGGGPIIAPPGTAPTDVGLGVGDAVTGFYRQGTSLAIAALGDVHMLFNANRTAQLMWPLAMSGNVISDLADATAADHALSRGAADARYLTPAIGDTRYLPTVGGAVSGPIVLLASPPTIDFHAANKLYVDDAIAAVASPSAFRNQVFETNEVVIASPSGPALVLDQNVDMPPTGFRYVLVTIDPLFAVATNPTSPAYSLLYSCLLIPTYEVPVLVYSWRGQPGGLDTDFWRSSAKFRAAVDSSPGSIRVQVFVRCVTAGNPNLIQLGANSTIVTNMRSLVGVQDLGPV